MAWQWDAPSGTYRNHTLSDKIRNVALARTVFTRYLSQEPGFGKKRGESLTITRMLQLPPATRVGETDLLPSGRPEMETKSIRISEWGYKIPFTDFETQLNKFDILNQFQIALRNQIEQTLDLNAAEAFKATPIKYVPTATSFSLTTNGVPGAVSDRNLSVQDLRELHDYMHGDLKIPPYSNGKYVGILSTRAARGLKNDPEYKDWISPTSSEPLMSGQLKDIEGFHLVETNNYGNLAGGDDALDNLAGTSTTTGEAVFFGADAAGLLQLQAPELRTGLPADLGRFREVGWVGILESFLVWERPDLARVIHVTSL